MQITTDRVVTLTYTLRDADSGQEFEQRSEDEPFIYLHGHGNIIPGMESELEGREPGYQFNLKIEPDDAYGEHNPKLMQSLSRDEFPDDIDLEVGTIIELVPQDADEDAEGMLFYIKKLTDTRVTLDGNPPLAGHRLHFVGTVVDVREADEDEIAHGHVHGDDDDEC